MNSPTPRKLGQILLDKHLLLPEQLELALTRQRQSGKRLGQILVALGFVSHDDICAATSEQAGVPRLKLRRGLIDPKVIAILPHDKATAFMVMPMFKVHGVLTMAMVDASDLFVIDSIQSLTGYKIQPVQCDAETIKGAIAEYYDVGLDMEQFIESFKEIDVEVVENYYLDLEMIDELAEGAKIINLVNMVLLSAIRDGVSDIHIEPGSGCTRVRFRIDGVLQQFMSSPSTHHAAMVSRIKVMAKMDIAERRRPQDGRIHVRAESREVDVRVSTMPTVLAEKIVMRILDRGQLVLDLNQIGFCATDLARLKAMLSQPSGMVLVTGPTGSGKTTTLYCGLQFLSSIEKNIISIEDPVEYQLDLVNQVQVASAQGLTFATTLRSVLRQDPDIIMIGEIRDRETAEVAIHAALTGHMVLATLHTNDSAGAVARMVEMGVEPYLLASAVIGVVAQRLLRRVCSHCRTTYLPPDDLLRRLGWQGQNRTFVTGRGCEHCFDSGLRGRAGIFEVLTINEQLRDLIMTNPTMQAIRSEGMRAGMQTLQSQAFALVEAGDTTIEEVMRVITLSDLIETAHASTKSEGHH